MALLLIILLMFPVSLSTFFKDNKELRHLCHININDAKYKTEWVVAGRKNSGKLFALHGFDTYEFD